jgi:all-trans-retinol 13,14-reductase
VNHPRYFQERYGDVWNLGAYDADSFPQGFMYVTPPTKGQGKWAKRMIVNTLMPFSVVQSWENTTVGHRGQDYEAWKEASMNKILDKIDMLHPGFRGTIASSFASSPLTIRDYYGTKDGSLYGHVVDCQNFLASQMPIATKIHNLLLTGQNVNLHGICGVPLTALETAEAIVGNGIILNKLNNNGSRND